MLERALSRLLVPALAVLVAAAPPPAPDPRMDVDLDPALESLYALRELSKPADAAPDALVLSELGSLRKDPAVALDAGLSRDSFSTSLRHELLTRLALVPWERLEPGFLRRASNAAGGEDKAKAFAAAAAEFGRRPAFQKYLARRRALAAPVLETLRAQAARADFLRAFEAYTGLEFRGTHALRLSPFPLGDFAASFGLVIRMDDGSYRLMNVVKDGSPSLPADPVMGGSWPVWHEEAHATVDLLADLFAEEIERSAGLLAQAGSAGAFGMSWRQAVKENINDAIAMRLLEKSYGREARLDAQFWVAKKSPWVPALVERLELYEKRRKAGEGLAESYALLLDAFPPAGPAPKGSLVEMGELENAFTGWSPEARPRVLALADRALKGAPSVRRYTLAAALRCLAGKASDCLKDAEKALALRPQDAAGLALRAAAERALGRDEAAAKDYSRMRAVCGDRKLSKEEAGCRVGWPETLIPEAERWLETTPAVPLP